MSKYTIVLIFVIVIALVSLLYLGSDDFESHSEITNGSWAEYNATITNFNPLNKSEIVTQTSRIKFEVREIQERTITFDIINLYDDGSADQKEISGVIGKDDIEGFLIPSSLNIDDTVVMGDYYITIEGNEEEVICQKNRRLVFADVYFFEGMRLFWDKETGIMVEGTNERDLTVYNIKMVKTNIW